MGFTGTMPLPCTKFIGGRLVVSIVPDMANMGLVRVLRNRWNNKPKMLTKRLGHNEFYLTYENCVKWNGLEFIFVFSFARAGHEIQKIISNACR
jgi:hypothetical protein